VQVIFFNKLGDRSFSCAHFDYEYISRKSRYFDQIRILISKFYNAILKIYLSGYLSPMKKLLAILIIISITERSQSAFGQNIIPKFIRKMYFERDTSKRSSFVLLPVLSSAPETGIEIGGAALYSFYTDTLHPETRVSNIYAYATITAKGQNRLNLSTNNWSSQNKYHYVATLNFINFPADFYGIGNNTSKVNADIVGEKRYKLSFEGEKLVAKNLYLGFATGGYNYAYRDDVAGGIFSTDPTIQDRDGGSLVFIGPSLIFDSRNNVTYTTKGAIINASFNLQKGIFGNNSYTGGLLDIRYSQFIPLSKKFVLGLDIQDQSLTGNQSPFYLLPQMGNDEIMRGYYKGRYRDRNLIASQAELRYRITERFGMVGFVGAGEVFNSAFSFAQLKPNYGGGARYFFDIEKGLSIRIDYGFGQQPTNEKRESGLYVALGQAF
jgi:hypothetical protein